MLDETKFVVSDFNEMAWGLLGDAVRNGFVKNAAWIRYARWLMTKAEKLESSWASPEGTCYKIEPWKGND